MTEVFIQGFLGRDAVVRETDKGLKFLTFSVCSSDYFNGKPKEQWFDCSWFGYNEKFSEYLKKGSSVNVVGSLDSDIETTDNKVFIRRRVTVHTVTFVSTGKPKDGTQQEVQGDAAEPEKEQPQVKRHVTPTPPSDEEITVKNASTKKFVAEEENNSDLPF